MRPESRTKFIFVTGGVVSGIGKGLTAASLGMLLKAQGYSVVIQKYDPYLNVDPGTLSPKEHGEVFVTDDGTEADLDLGHYERFLDINLDSRSSVTAGKIYFGIIESERAGKFLGHTIQMIPHVTDRIKETMYALSGSYDIVMIEIGGTIGDIESNIFIEAVRQITNELPDDNVCTIHVSYVPFILGSKEIKSKPTQHSVRNLFSLGIQPNVLVCRCDRPLPRAFRQKMASFCNVQPDCVIENRTLSSIYELPLTIQDLATVVMRKLRLIGDDEAYQRAITPWVKMVESQRAEKPHKCTIAICGKYLESSDAYLSVIEALNHAANSLKCDLEIRPVDTEELEAAADTPGAEGDTTLDSLAAEMLSGADGILVPGGFGKRGVEGMLACVKYAREHDIPYFGICLGMQCACIEFARNVLHKASANSLEFDPATPDPVIGLIASQKGVIEGAKAVGGTMRLGAYPCILAPESRAATYYRAGKIEERHRHRYEFNPEYKAAFEEAGMVFSGICPEGGLVEIVELPKQKFFIAGQFHPEFKSRPLRPHPLFREFVHAAMKTAE